MKGDVYSFGLTLFHCLFPLSEYVDFNSIPKDSNNQLRDLLQNLLSPQPETRFTSRFYLFIYLSIYLFIYLFIYLTIYFPFREALYHEFFSGNIEPTPFCFPTYFNSSNGVNFVDITIETKSAFHKLFEDVKSKSMVFFFLLKNWYFLLFFKCKIIINYRNFTLKKLKG